jgi:hypothetical protein
MENEAIPLLEGIRAFLRELYPGKCYEIRVSTTKLYPERLEVSIIRHPEEDWAGEAETGILPDGGRVTWKGPLGSFDFKKYSWGGEDEA